VLRPPCGPDHILNRSDDASAHRRRRWRGAPLACLSHDGLDSGLRAYAHGQWSLLDRPGAGGESVGGNRVDDGAQESGSDERGAYGNVGGGGGRAEGGGCG